MANPSCAFQEWLRVLKKKGVIFLVLPDKGGTFDDLFQMRKVVFRRLHFQVAHIAGRAWHATLSWTEIEQANLTAEH